jgi:hypothetical protein
VVIGWGWGPGWFWIVGLVFFALTIGSIVWLIVSLSRPGHWTRPYWGPGWYGPTPPQAQQSPALQELDIAYARGQLSREEYFRRRADLTGWSPPGGAPGFSGGSARPDPGAPANPSTS